MKLGRLISRNQDGAATIEMAFALPILIVLIWMFVQFAQIYRAMAGIQQALGEGARFATLCLTPSSTAGCSVPTTAQVKTRISDSVYGIGPGTFTVTDPTTRDGRYSQILRSDRQLHPADQPAAVPRADDQRQPFEARLDRQ